MSLLKTSQTSGMSRAAVLHTCCRAKHDARCLPALVYTREAVHRFALQLGQVNGPIHLCVTLVWPSHGSACVQVILVVPVILCAADLRDQLSLSIRRHQCPLVKGPVSVEEMNSSVGPLRIRGDNSDISTGTTQSFTRGLPAFGVTLLLKGRLVCAGPCSQTWAKTKKGCVSTHVGRGV